MNILADASIPHLSDYFSKHFEITLFHHNEDVKNLLRDQDILFCRSTLAVNESLLSQHSPRVVATASSGVDHIDLDFLKSRNIHVLDARGSNARAVADYVMASVAWLQTFKGFRGKTAGIIGLGAVGSLVASRLQALQFDIRCYDPPKSTETADFKSCTLPDVMSSDLICVHANLHDRRPFPSRNLIDKPQLALIRKGSAIINASRGGIVSETALLESGRDIYYCTDVYSAEPMMNQRIVDYATLCTPHIAGHSIEAKASAVNMIAKKLHQFYQLPYPFSPSPTSHKTLVLNASNDWQTRVLSLYNPIHETLALKQANDMASAFVQVRRAHQYRHDFDGVEIPMQVAMA